MKKSFTLVVLTVLACMLGNRALAQTTVPPFTEYAEDDIDFTWVDQANYDWDYINFDGNYIQSFDGDPNREFKSIVNGQYRVSVSNVNTSDTKYWQIGKDTDHGNNNNRPSYLQTDTDADLYVYIHNLNVGDVVRIRLAGNDGEHGCTIVSTNTINSDGVDPSTVNNGALRTGQELRVTSPGNITLKFNKRYAGIRKIEIDATLSQPRFNYDPGYEVYDMFELRDRIPSNNNHEGEDESKKNEYTTTGAGFNLNGKEATYFTFDHPDENPITLNNRIAISDDGDWVFARGLQGPNYSPSNSTWYNFSICNLKEGDRVEIFYTGTAPKFSSVGENGVYTGCPAYLDQNTNGIFDNGDHYIELGESLQSVGNRREGNICDDAGYMYNNGQSINILLHTSATYVITQDGHLDLGLINGNHTRIVKVKIFSDHQASMIDGNTTWTSNGTDYKGSKGFFDITGELQAKEHIVPGGLEVRIGNEDENQHALVVSSKDGPVSYVNAVDGFKLPGITKDNNGKIQPSFDLATNVPSTGTFYKFIPQNNGRMKVKFVASSMNYYRYDLPGYAIYTDDIKPESPWRASFDRANEQTVPVSCPYYVKESYYGDLGNEIDWLPNNNVLTIDEIAEYNPDGSDIITFYIDNVTNSSFGCLSGYNWTNQTNFTTNETGNLQFTYTFEEIQNIAGGTGVIEVHFWSQGNGTLSRVTLTTSSSSPSSSGTVYLVKGANAIWDGSDQASSSKVLENGEIMEFEIDVEAGKTYYLYGGWNSTSSSTNYNIGPQDNQPKDHACGVAKLLEVSFAADKDIHPLAKWVPNATTAVNTEDYYLADVIGYDTDDLIVKKMSGNIQSCHPYISSNGKLMIDQITYTGESVNKGGVILIKVGDPADRYAPVYALTIAYDAAYTNNSQRGHTWDFSSKSLRGLEWNPSGTDENNKPVYSENGATPSDFGTYFEDYFNGDLDENGSIDDNGEPHGSLLYREMNYKVNGVDRSDWMFNYRLQLGDDFKDPRFLSKYDMEGDNADMMWDTEGVVFLTSSNQSCLFNEYLNSGDTDHKNTINRTVNNGVAVQKNDPNRYIGVLPGGEFLIPWLDKDDRVIIYMGSGEGSGNEVMKFRISNARDALYNIISEDVDYVAGGSQWNGEKGDPYYRGCYHFFATGDGKGGPADMRFKLESGSVCKIYSIQIYSGDRIITNDVVGSGENDKFLLWSTEADPNDGTGKSKGSTYNWTLKYFGKDQKLADGSNSVVNEIIAQTGNIPGSITTDATNNTFTYAHDYGQFGTFRVRGKDMEQNMKYVADYADHNVTVAYQQTQPYPYTWDFTDVTGIEDNVTNLFDPEEQLGESTSADEQNNEIPPTGSGVSQEVWNSIPKTSYQKTARDLSLWEVYGTSGNYFLRLNSQTSQNRQKLMEKDNIFESAKEIGGNQVWANETIVPEMQGLWFYTEEYDPETGKSYDNLQSNGEWRIIQGNEENVGGLEISTGNLSWFNKIVVPNVPANAAVYLRMNKLTGSTVEAKVRYMFGQQESMSEISTTSGTSTTETFYSIGNGDYIVAIKNTNDSKSNLTLSLYGYRIQKLAVSEDPKKIGKTGFATESRTRLIDHDLTEYFTGIPVKAYQASLDDEDKPTKVVLTHLRFMPAAPGIEKNDQGQVTNDGLQNNAGLGCILYNDAVANSDENIGKKVDVLDGGFHLFVPDMHDNARELSDWTDLLCKVNKNILRSCVPAATSTTDKLGAEAENGDIRYILSAQPYKPTEEGYAAGDGGKAGLVGFYKIDPRKGANKTGNIAYMQLSSSQISNSKVSMVFFDELIFEDNSGITTAVESVEATRQTQDGWYNLNGQKLNGAPTAKGLYIVNGKKVMVK